MDRRHASVGPRHTLAHDQRDSFAGNLKNYVRPLLPARSASGFAPRVCSTTRMGRAAGTSSSRGAEQAPKNTQHDMKCRAKGPCMHRSWDIHSISTGKYMTLQQMTCGWSTRYTKRARKDFHQTGEKVLASACALWYYMSRPQRAELTKPKTELRT